MNDADVSRQIQQMVRFIRQEAEEKANEISVSAEEVSSLSLSWSISLTDVSSYFTWSSNLMILICWIVMLQEFNIEKLQLVEAEKKKIRQEYEKKEKQVDVRRKM